MLQVRVLPGLILIFRRKRMKKIINYIKESYAELKKVIWPNREEVFSSTKVVIISTIFIAAALGLIDIVLYRLLNIIF
jgi:preprotein translocase subunit SecE